ncbi:MAG: cytochrome B [Nevskiaceae bacterium]|nr:MAG: cytochrome B [Nevskiaceae bacterium]TAM24955.1 MAG: cytochrome B [Nevskiaceae bacterium]
MAREPAELVVWDPWVRVFHWSTAGLFLLDYWLLEGGETPHEYVGYAIAALLVSRLIWGGVGSRNARFSSFWPTPTRLRRHLRQLRQRRFDPAEGHNPLGALMILLMLLLLALTVVSGWMQGLDRFWGEDWVALLHEYSAHSLMGAVGLHVSAVLVMSRYSGLRLVRTMITGRRSAGAGRERAPSR